MRYGLLLLGVIAAPVYATPTYLACTFPTEKGPLAVNVAADEENQVATVSLPSTGAVDRRPAVFSAGEVKFSVPISNLFGVAYTISRTDLTITRQITGIASTPTTGTCKVDTPPKRAF